jgi:hypothetical protein
MLMIYAYFYSLSVNYSPESGICGKTGAARELEDAV